MSLAAIVVFVVAIGLVWWRVATSDPFAGPEPTPTSAAPATPAGPSPQEPAGPSPAGAPTPAAPASAALVAAACSGELGVRDLSAIVDPELDEISGIAASRLHDGVLWAIEDSLNPADLVAIGADGATLATIEVGAVNFDWEDLAAGLGPDGAPWLYIADIGDNFGVRSRVSVLALPEPELADGSVTPTELRLDIEGGPVDAEALVVTGHGYWLIAKVADGSAAPIYLAEPGSERLARVGSLDAGGQAVTAADVTPDGSALVVRTYQRVLVYPIVDGDLRTAGAVGACEAPAIDEPQGESLAVTADSTAIVTVSEGAGAVLHELS